MHELNGYPMGPRAIPIFNIDCNSMQPDIRVSTLSCYVHYIMPVAINCDNATVKTISMNNMLQELKHRTQRNTLTFVSLIL